MMLNWWVLPCTTEKVPKEYSFVPSQTSRNLLVLTLKLLSIVLHKEWLLKAGEMAGWVKHEDLSLGPLERAGGWQHRNPSTEHRVPGGTRADPRMRWPARLAFL